MQQDIKKLKSLFKPNNPFYLLTIILSILALTSTALLDYISFRQKHISYLPWSEPRARVQAAQQSSSLEKTEFSLSEFINKSLLESGVSRENITEEKTEDGLIYFSIRTTEAEFNQLKNKLSSRLKKQKIKTRLFEQETVKSGEKVIALEMKQQSRISGWIIFRYSVSPPPAITARKSEPPAPRADKKEPAGLVALVIDDMGADLSILEELISLNVPLTIAVLPDSPYAKETAELAHKNGLEVIIHLPLEAFNSQVSSAGADGLIKTSMSYQEVWSILEKDFAQVPYAKGLNNHMGSKATADPQLMEIIMSFLKEKNLFFLDSKTSPRSIAYELALRNKIPAASRQVFLDADQDRSKIKDRLFELFSYAKKNGQAVGIGHPFPETINTLKTYLNRAQDYGLKLVPVSSLIIK